MRSNWYAAIFVGSLMLAVLAVGAPSNPTSSDTSSASETTTADTSATPAATADTTSYSAASGSANSLIATTPGSTWERASLKFETRPEMNLNAEADNSFRTDNWVEAGYAVSNDVSLAYRQQFTTNLSGHADHELGNEILAHDGYFRANIPSLFTSADGRTSLSYTPRLYVPTHAPKRDAGMLGILRNYLTLSHDASSTTTLKASLVPILHIYDVPGKGAASNPAFENRVVLEASFKLTDRLTFIMPAMWYATRYRDFAPTATKNATWDHMVYTWPELAYKLTPAVNVGLAYYTGNLTDGDLGNWDIGNGLKNGTFQVFLNTTIL